MGHYKSNLRDLEFNLFEVFRRQDLLGSGPYAELDEDTVRSILDEVNRLAEGPLADSFEDADRHPPKFDPAVSTVEMPESFKKSYKAWMDAEWYRLDLVPEFGGSGAPRSLTWAVAEQVLGPTRPSTCSPPAPVSPRSCGTSARPSRRSSPSWPLSGSGAPRWC